jgi:hypothetical protein
MKPCIAVALKGHHVIPMGAVFIIALSPIVGLVAHRMGHPGFRWFVVSLLVSPIIAVIILLWMGRKQETPATVGHRIEPYYDQANISSSPTQPPLLT